MNWPANCLWTAGCLNLDKPMGIPHQISVIWSREEGMNALVATKSDVWRFVVVSHHLHQIWSSSSHPTDVDLFNVGVWHSILKPHQRKLDGSRPEENFELQADGDVEGRVSDDLLKGSPFLLQSSPVNRIPQNMVSKIEWQKATIRFAYSGREEEQIFPYRQDFANVPLALTGQASPLAVGSNDDAVTASQDDDASSLRSTSKKEPSGKQWRYVRINAPGLLVVWRDKSGAGVYKLSQLDMDVSDDREKWFHWAGPECRFNLSPAENQNSSRQLE